MDPKAKSISLNEPMNDPKAYWRASLKLVLVLLVVWFSASFGCGILFREWLDANAPAVGNAPFGFWMAQQGAIISFVILLIVYAVVMNHLDAKYGYKEKVKSEKVHGS